VEWYSTVWRTGRWQFHNPSDLTAAWLSTLHTIQHILALLPLSGHRSAYCSTWFSKHSNVRWPDSDFHLY
jgi:hypothetical protein